MKNDNIESFLRNNKPQVEDNPAFLLEVRQKINAVDGIKSEVDRQRRTGRVALVAALVIGLLMGSLAMFLVWLYPVSTPEVGSELISKIQSAIEPYKQYLLLPIAGCAIFLGLIFGREERRVF
jgi:cell division protein FtsX